MWGRFLLGSRRAGYRSSVALVICVFLLLFMLYYNFFGTCIVALTFVINRGKICGKRDVGFPALENELGYT